MDENERVKLKYELLMSEIQECREDERNELNADINESLIVEFYNR